MIKNTLKNIYYKTSDFTGISNYLVNKTIKQDKLILTYHNVIPQKEFTPFYTNYVDLTIDVFRKHLEIITKSYGINPISSLTDKDKKGIYLSFDDAMLNNLEIIAPILKEYGVTAMFGACSGLVKKEIDYIWRDHIFLMLKNSLDKSIIIPSKEGEKKVLVTRKEINSIASYITKIIQEENLMSNVYTYLKTLKEFNNIEYKNVLDIRYKSLSVGELNELKYEGHSIASHTHSHKKLSYLTKEEQFFELNESKVFLDKNIGITEQLVYPYGTYNEVDKESIRLAKEIGYKHAYLNFKNIKEDNFTISRLNVTNIKSQSVLKGVLARINKF